MKKLVMAVLLAVFVFTPIFAVFASSEVVPQVAGGYYHTFGLNSDGTVVAVGNNGSGQGSMDDWGNIIQISAGYYHDVGLESNGTVVAVGANSWGQLNVGDWNDIVQVVAGYFYTVGLKSDGTVVAVGYNIMGNCNVDTWSNIIQVAANRYHTVGLKSDGTVVAVGKNSYGDLNVGDWSNIVQVAAGDSHTVGLKNDGTVVAIGYGLYGQLNVSDWSDVIQISADNHHTVGLKSDGTVVATGYNYCGQCNVNDWSDIIHITTGAGHTIGLKSDGTVLAVGWNIYGQCNVGDWNLGAQASELTLEDLNQSFAFSWADTLGPYDHAYESMYAIIQNCLQDPNYTYLGIGANTNDEIRTYYKIGDQAILSLTVAQNLQVPLICPWFDANWNNDLSTDDSFNIVYRYKGPIEEVDIFEVISRVDEYSPIDGTTNDKCVFFTYDSKNDAQGQTVTLGEWVAYLQAIRDNYRPIDKLTIFSHGYPGVVSLSEDYPLQTDYLTETEMKKLLWNEETQEGILAKNAVIQLFSCNVGQGDLGKSFVRNLANWTGATVYANTEATGDTPDKEQNGDYISQDWNLDIVGIPDSYSDEEPHSVFVQANIDTTLLMPGGVTVKINKGALSNDGTITIDRKSVV